MLFDANEWVGTPYSELSCWDLVAAVCTSLCRPVPSFETPEPDQAAKLWIKVETVEAGDVLLFSAHGVVYHAGIAIDGAYFLHTQMETGAIIELLNDGYWNERIEGIYRYGKTGSGGSVLQSI